MDPRISINKMTPFPDIQLPRLLKYIFKILWSILSLLSIFLSVPKANMLMLQNPPGIPALALCYLYCKFSKAKFIIDWHNYTWSIMALDLSPESRVVRAAKSLEFHFGRKSDLNFCVTRAMQQDLAENWNITATVLYDRPPERFKPLTIEEKHEYLMDASFRFPEIHAPHPTNFKEMTAFTTKDDEGKVEPREDDYLIEQWSKRMIISSTSWTPDEDFQILLDALLIYEEAAKRGSDYYIWNEDKRDSADKKILAERKKRCAKTYRKLVCVITGKGPQKEMYKEKIAKLDLKFVSIVTPWLEPEEYPMMLAAADVGISLHKSSSGLDLPMKVVDMLGCEIPVFAMKFNW